MIEVAAAVIIRKDQIFLASRPADKPPAGWEFPGGKLEPGEDAFAAVKRELIEELSWDVIPQETLYSLTTDHITLHFILCRPVGSSAPIPRENQQCKWVDISAGIPDGLLPNDIEFWNFLTRNKINSPSLPLMG